MDTARLSSQFAAQDHVCHSRDWPVVRRFAASRCRKWKSACLWSFRNVPENLEIGSDRFRGLEIRVRGPARIVRDLKTSDVRAEIDLAGSQPGERTF